MRFPYRGRRKRGAPRVIPAKFQPIIYARAIGLSRDAVIFGLLDTGAEITVLDISYIDDLDVHIKPGDHEVLVGITGGAFRAPCGTIDIELASSRRRTVHRWRSRVAFAERRQNEGAIFGHEGFLEYFSASFHGPKRVVTLTPRVPLPRACMPVP